MSEPGRRCPKTGLEKGLVWEPTFGKKIARLSCTSTAMGGKLAQCLDCSHGWFSSHSWALILHKIRKGGVRDNTASS